MTDNISEIIFDDGESYERFMGVWSRKVGVQFIDWIKFSKSLNFLDVGCGNGAFSVQIDELCNPSSIIGIDPSSAQIDYASRREINVPSQFEVGDSMSLPFQDDKFDASIMALVIFIVPDPIKGVAEMLRVTKPGGTLAAYAWDVMSGGLPMEPMHKILREIGIEYPLPPSVHASQKRNMNEIWTDLGMSGVETTTFYVKRSFKNFDDYWNIYSVGPSMSGTLKALSPETVTEIKVKLNNTLERDSDDNIITYAFANAVKGVKTES